MTYSVVAWCPRTGRFGVGAASFSMAIGAGCSGAIRPHVGATFTQGAPLVSNNRLAINSLAQGCTPALALAALEQNDAKFAYRQIAVVDREGNAVGHTGEHVRRLCGQRVGPGYVIMGNTLATESVLDAMVARFEAAASRELDDRILSTLEAGRDAGGFQGSSGALPARSVAVVVWKSQDYSEVDLRVDLDDDAIAKLRQLYADYKPTAEYYEERARHPRNAIPAMEFADMLRKKQEKERS